MSRYSRLTGGSAAFSSMLKRFGVVTVMNAKVYDILPRKTSAEDTEGFNFEENHAEAIVAEYKANGKLRCTLDTLKIANASQEGPTKTITGGQYANPLIKYGKTARLEMQDALGNAEAIEALCGGLVEYNVKPSEATEQQVDEGRIALHVGSDFASPKLIIGDSFFIDQVTGEQVKVLIVFYQFLPDSIFNLTQDAEGDATVFDMNGDLLTTNILVGDENGEPTVHGEFYTVLSDPLPSPANEFDTSSGE